MGRQERSNTVGRTIRNGVATIGGAALAFSIACGDNSKEAATPTPVPAPSPSSSIPEITALFPSSGNEFTVFLNPGQSATVQGKGMTIENTLNRNCQPDREVFPDGETKILITPATQERSIRITGVKTGANIIRRWTVDPNSEGDYWSHIEEITTGKPANFAVLDPNSMQVVREGSTFNTRDQIGSPKPEHIENDLPYNGREINASVGKNEILVIVGNGMTVRTRDRNGDTTDQRLSAEKNIKTGVIFVGEGEDRLVKVTDVESGANSTFSYVFPDGIKSRDVLDVLNEIRKTHKTQGERLNSIVVGVDGVVLMEDNNNRCDYQEISHKDPLTTDTAPTATPYPTIPPSQEVLQQPDWTQRPYPSERFVPNDGSTSITR